MTDLVWGEVCSVPTGVTGRADIQKRGSDN